MTQLYTITWQSPHGKQVTSSHHTEAQARALIEQNKQHTPDWTYTVEPPLPNLQALLDAANARIAELESSEHQLRYQHLQQYEQMLATAEKRIAELEAVCREVVRHFMVDLDSRNNEMSACIGDGFVRHIEKGSLQYKTFRRLLDTLPPSE